MDIILFLKRYEEEQGVNFNPVITLKEEKKNKKRLKVLEIHNDKMMIAHLSKVDDQDITHSINDYLLRRDYQEKMEEEPSKFYQCLSIVANAYLKFPDPLINF